MANLNVRTRGDPRVTVAYDGAEVDSEPGCVVLLEIVGIVLFLIMVGVLR
jgi:hypothetical protein